jgi:hypothetical protein
MAQFQPFVNNSKIIVRVYNPIATCEDLRVLTADNIVPVFMHLLFACSGLSVDTATAKFRAIQFIEDPLPARLTQAPEFNAALSHIFAYVASLIPKNPTLTLTRHLSMKEKGLIRAMEELNLTGLVGNYVIDLLALESLQTFMNRHTDVMAHTFVTLLGIANVKARHIAYSYVQELLPGLYYANMNSVRILEEHIVTINHPCLANGIVNGSYKEYMAFKRKAQEKFGIH